MFITFAILHDFKHVCSCLFLSNRNQIIIQINNQICIVFNFVARKIAPYLAIYDQKSTCPEWSNELFLPSKTIFSIGFAQRQIAHEENIVHIWWKSYLFENPKKAVGFRQNIVRRLQE